MNYYIKEFYEKRGYTINNDNIWKKVNKKYDIEILDISPNKVHIFLWENKVKGYKEL